MSWSVSVSSQPANHIIDALDKSFEVNYSNASTGVFDQYDVAKKAVANLLVFVRGNLFNCSVSGHCQQFDEDENPTDSKDSINISLNAVG